MVMGEFPTYSTQVSPHFKCSFDVLLSTVIFAESRIFETSPYSMKQNLDRPLGELRNNQTASEMYACKIIYIRTDKNKDAVCRNFIWDNGVFTWQYIYNPNVSTNLPRKEGCKFVTLQDWPNSPESTAWLK